MTIVRKQDGFKNASRRYYIVYIAQVFPPWFVRETVGLAAIACTRVGRLSKSPSSDYKYVYTKEVMFKDRRK